MKINDAVLKYYSAFCDFREDWELPDEEELAFRNIQEAFFRIENDVRADLDDLPLHESIRIAHLLMGWPANTVPSLSDERPLYRMGKYQPLNNAIVTYFNRLQRYRERFTNEGSLFRRSHEPLHAVLHEALRRITKDRNARVDDLPLLETIHKVHRLLELDPVDVPHLDVSRYYEGETVHDSIDESNRIRAANEQKLRRPRPLALPR